MGDSWLIVGAIILINCGWWLIFEWFLAPQFDRLARELDAACDRMEGQITRANKERDEALAEVERLKAERARLLAWATEAVSDRSVIMGMGEWSEADVLHCAGIDRPDSDPPTRKDRPAAPA